MLSQLLSTHKNQMAFANGEEIKNGSLHIAIKMSKEQKRRWNISFCLLFWFIMQILYDELSPFEKSYANMFILHRFVVINYSWIFLPIGSNSVSNINNCFKSQLTDSTFHLAHFQ